MRSCTGHAIEWLRTLIKPSDVKNGPDIDLTGKMRKLIVLIIMAAWFAAGAQDIKTIAPTDSVMVAGDSIGNATVSTAVAGDSIGKRSWWKELKRGKVDLNSDTIQYPRLIKWGWNVWQNFNRIVNDYDTAYVKGTGKKFRVNIKNEYWCDDYDFVLDDDMKLKFNSKITSGIGAYVSALGATLGYQFSINQLLGRGNRSRKFEVSYSCARFMAEYYNMSNTGDMTMTYLLKNGEKYPLTNFTGIRRRSWGINAFYIFNHKHYSHPAAYGFSKVQLRSCGSFLAGFNISHRNFAVKYNELPEFFRDIDDDDDEIYDTDYIETIFEYTDYSLSVGYGYSWVLGRGFMVNGTGVVYSGVQTAHSKSIADGGCTFWAVNAKLKASIVYNRGMFFGGIHGYLDSHFFNTGEYKFHSHLYDFSITAGVQF